MKMFLRERKEKLEVSHWKFFILATAIIIQLSLTMLFVCWEENHRKFFASRDFQWECVLPRIRMKSFLNARVLRNFYCEKKKNNFGWNFFSSFLLSTSVDFPKGKCGNKYLISKRSCCVSFRIDSHSSWKRMRKKWRAGSRINAINHSSLKECVNVVICIKRMCWKIWKMIKWVANVINRLRDKLRCESVIWKFFPACQRECEKRKKIKILLKTIKIN